MIGDSHAQRYAWGAPLFCTHWLGNVTAHNLHKLESTSNGWVELQKNLARIPKADPVMFLVGEIDCRIHVYYQHKKQGRPMDALLRETIHNYGRVLRHVKENQGYHVIAHSIPPAGRQGNIFKYPYYAPPAIRADIHREFNALLAAYCVQHGIPMINIYPLVVNREGMIDVRYKDDSNTHLNERAVGLTLLNLAKRGYLATRVASEVQRRPGTLYAIPRS